MRYYSKRRWKKSLHWYINISHQKKATWRKCVENDKLLWKIDDLVLCSESNTVFYSVAYFLSRKMTWKTSWKCSHKVQHWAPTYKFIVNTARELNSSRLFYLMFHLSHSGFSIIFIRITWRKTRNIETISRDMERTSSIM